MKPHLHTKNSIKNFGGKAEDYQAIHDFIDSSKSCVADMRHRAVLHSAFGIYIVERVFGTLITNVDNAKVSTRDIAENHVIEDLGKIPSLQDYLDNMELQEWMGGPVRRKRKFIKID
jgi:Domain of unknown function (DUF6915)